MKPIWMRMKGLNSFLEAQEIDFEQLTSHGLFGIFGPTGSGKSSILDGITIALYGTTSRNSTNYINVNTDRASVDYIFSVKGKKQRIYRVSRSFKRSKEGTIRSDSAKFAEITGEEPQILADRVTTVNEKCREVIGLSKEDFFRTVVLPQGKFSEFLKLEGMERNKMLERLFHLERYGEHLVSLIKARENQWDGQKKEKEGALSRYQDVSKEKRNELKKQKTALAELLHEKEKVLVSVRKELEHAGKIFRYQEEYARLLRESREQETAKKEFLLLQEELVKAEKANILWSYLQDAQKAERYAVETLRQKSEIYKNWETKQVQAETIKKERTKVQQLAQKEIPLLELQKAKLEDVLSFQKEKQALEKTLKNSMDVTVEVKRRLEEQTCRMDVLTKDAAKDQKEKELLLQDIKEVTVSAQMQNAVLEGYRLSQAIADLNERKKNDSLQMKKWKTKQETAEKELEQILQQEKEWTLQGKELESASLKLQEEKEKLYLQNLAAILGANLKEGDACPVCGNPHPVSHTHENVNVDEEFSEINKLLAQNEQAHKELQEKLQNLRIIRTRKETEGAQFKIRLEEIGADERKLDADIRNKQNCLLEMKELHHIEEFLSAYKVLQENSKIREKKLKLFDETEKRLESRNAEKEQINQIIRENMTKLAETQMLVKQMQMNIEKLDAQIFEKTGTSTDPKAEIEKISGAILKIQRENHQKEVLWEQVNQEETQLRQTYAAKEALAKSAKQEAEEKAGFLMDKMQAFEIAETSWIENFKKEEAELLTIKDKIEAFKETAVKLKTQLEQVRNLLQEQSVSEEELQNLEQKVKNLEQEINEQNKMFGAVKTELEYQEKAWAEKENLLKDLKEISHKQEILEDLDSLFRGKKFVEYVSRYYLEYVSREADECLKEMTGSSYGLETDGNGMFVIRDYKNGGILRPASTLSGGETFLASLALALALSSQIQMKGAAPLELFFLDEGFGTLDENYLEVVMESLEKIRTKKRSVGVITHVEEIKARIPVKLLVEPAKAGEGGSKIRIENTI